MKKINIKIVILIFLSVILIHTFAFGSNTYTENKKATELYGSNKSGHTSNFELSQVLFPICISAIVYLSVPLFFKYKKMLFYDISQVKQFVIANSVIVCFIYFIVACFTKKIYLYYLILPIVYGFINFLLLKENIEIPSAKLHADKSDSINNNIKDTPKIKEKIPKNNIPMTWFNFWKYFRIPFGTLSILCSILNTYMLNENEITIFFIIDLIFLILCSMNLYYLYNPKPFGYVVNTSMIFVSTIYSAISTVLQNLSTQYSVIPFEIFCEQLFGVIVIMVLIWCLPNYIYFKKRKFYFES